MLLDRPVIVNRINYLRCLVEGILKPTSGANIARLLADAPFLDKSTGLRYECKVLNPYIAEDPG